MSLFDQTGEVIKQASRRGAQIGILDIDHPDVEGFINYKSTLDRRNFRLLDELQMRLSLTSKEDVDILNEIEKTLLDNQLTHFNISINLTDKFMNAVINGEDWDLISPQTGEVIKTVKAKDLLYLIAERAWESGDPGLFFQDRVNEDNMVPEIGTIKTTNPCGEVPLFPGEACCLGSLNLHAFYDDETNTVNLELLEFVVRTAVRFLDNVQELSITGVDTIDKQTKGLRRLGLGVMGWADLLAELELPYDSKDAKRFAEYLSWFISFFAWLESGNLAQERSPFTMLSDTDNTDFKIVSKILSSKYTQEEFNIYDFKPRNVSVTAIAPTGTIALISNVNSSIEPFYLLAYKRNITEGIGNIAKDSVVEINPILLKKLNKLDYSEESIDEIKEFILENGTLQDCPLVPDKIKDIFKTAHEIDYTDHIDMQAMWQNYITNSVSKTINMPTDSTIDDVYNAFIYMWQSGLKGGTIYRDKSKLFQILNKV
jgi:ribonucleoside-diphosphate reductase alpha chain